MKRLRVFCKNLICRLHLAGFFDLIEYCDDCGIRQPLVWYSDDALWLEITGDVGGVLCPKCFTRRADQKRIWIKWTPVKEDAVHAEN
jgi:hypothetical protein